MALAIALTAPAAATALPAGFWGAVPQNLLSQGQLERLRRGGVDAIRMPIAWPGVELSRGADFYWQGYDSQFAAAAKAGLEVLPFLSGAPRWQVPEATVPGTHGDARAPLHLPVRGAAGRGWARFVHQAVLRYGPRGSFWAENPELPRRPVHAWQIWNEENFKYFVVRPNPGEYGRLVRRSASAVRSADPRATIILGGLFGRPAEALYRTRPRLAFYATDFLREMYRRTPGIRSKFDGIALHPYSPSYLDLAPEIEEVRAVLRANHDAGKKLWITELGWSSEHPSRRDSFAKGRRGQAAQLRGAFRVLRRNQRRWHLRQVYWFSVDDARGACNFCGGSGLFGRGFRPKPAWRAYVSFTGGTVR